MLIKKKAAAQSTPQKEGEHPLQLTRDMAIIMASTCAANWLASEWDKDHATPFDSLTEEQKVQGTALLLARAYRALDYGSEHHGRAATPKEMARVAQAILSHLAAALEILAADDDDAAVPEKSPSSQHQDIVM